MREWMYVNLIDGLLNPEFVAGIEHFVEFCKSMPQYAENGNLIRCPCSRCNNLSLLRGPMVKKHLYSRGFVPDYYHWKYQGESLEHFNAELMESQQYAGSSSAQPQESETDDAFDPADYQPFEQMIFAGAPEGVFEHCGEGNFTIPEKPNPEAQKIYDMLTSASRPLYEGSDMTQLCAATELLNIKSRNYISERGYNQIASWYRRCSPPENTMPESFYDTKKLLEGLGLPVKEIDCCTNHCMLYWGGYADLTECIFCGQRRFKRGGGGNISYSKMIYFPITERLQRLYAFNVTAEHMRWHDEHEHDGESLRHPSETMAWKHFDAKYPSFAAEVRNVRLGLCTDGFNPFGASGAQYSCWPVIVTPYNLPPSICMKDPVMFLTILVPGPRSPKQKIDVFLQPLVEELGTLWTEGAITYDVSRKQNFKMRAALLWTISDFPAYSMLSGWSTAGKYACPHCNVDTEAFWLKHGRKTCWFDCHRRFLPNDHPFRRNRRDFKKGRTVSGLGPPRMSGWDLLNQIDTLGIRRIIEVGAEEHNERARGDTGWKKRSIFWDLPYWGDLLIRHNLDVMHVEKNVFDNIFNTVLNISGKSKDNLRARLDIAEICRRPELVPQENSNVYVKGKYQLTSDQRREFFEWIRSVRFPDGYASNLTRCIDANNTGIYGMKSHDCHVFMQRLLPAALKPYLDYRIWEPLVQVSNLFKEITCSTVNVSNLQALHRDVALIICKLERIFPPSFFDSMEHLVVHLPFEALIAGPVQYRWMYPFERYIRGLKQTVGNKARVEGSIKNAYIVKESSHFSEFFFEQALSEEFISRPRNFSSDELPEGVDPNDLSVFTFNGRIVGRPSNRNFEEDEYTIMHTYILCNCPEVQPFIRLFLDSVVRVRYPNIDPNTEQEFVDNYFAKWFKLWVQLNMTHVKIMFNTD